MIPIVSNIEKICIKLLLKEPFYGHFLMGVPKSFDEKVPTAAVGLFEKSMIKLMINPIFWQNLSEEHQYGLVKHEVLHIVLKHLTISKLFNNKKLINVAADIVVNQYILANQLPEGAITLDFFKPLETSHNLFLERGKDVGYYYHKLLELIQNSSNINTKSDTMRALNEWLEGKGESIEKHNHWQDFDNLSSSEQRVLEQFVKNATKQTANRLKNKNWGNLPSELIEILEKTIAEPPQINWRRVLRLFSASSQSSFLQNTIRRPSKRYGVVPGIKIKRHHDLIVAIDTSGSINLDELNLFFSEIKHIWKNGAKVVIVECDYMIASIYSYKGVMPEFVKGRGGTSFNEPIKWANEKMPDAIIYFTDGYGAKPEVNSRVPILWVITSTGTDTYTHLPGKCIKLTLDQ